MSLHIGHRSFYDGPDPSHGIAFVSLLVITISFTEHWSLRCHKFFIFTGHETYVAYCRMSGDDFSAHWSFYDGPDPSPSHGVMECIRISNTVVEMLKHHSGIAARRLLTVHLGRHL